MLTWHGALLIYLVFSLTSPCSGWSVTRTATDICWWVVVRKFSVKELQLGRDVEIRESPGRGMGLFAIKQIRQGKCVKRYTGKLFTREQHQRRCDDGRTLGNYAFMLGENRVIDGECESSSSYVRYVNHSTRNNMGRGGKGVLAPARIRWEPHLVANRGGPCLAPRG